MTSAIAYVRGRLLTFLPVDSLRGRLASGVSWTLTGAVIAQAISAGASVAVARVLGQTGFGELGIVLSTVALFGVVAELAIGLAASKYVAQYRKVDPDRAGRILGLAAVVSVAAGCVMAVALVAFAGVLAARALGAPHVAWLLRLGSPMLVLGALTGVLSGALSGFELFKALARTRVILGLTSGVTAVVGVCLAGTPGVICGTIIGSTAGVLWLGRLVVRECRAGGVHIRLRGAWAELRVLWHFSLPLALSGVVLALACWAANAMLVKTPGGLGEFGVFNAADRWRNLVMFVPQAVASVALPMLSGLLAAGDVRRFGRALKMGVLVNLAVGLAAAAPICLFSYWIMRLYGAGFAPRWAALVVLALTAVVQATVGVIGQAMVSMERVWGAFWLNAAWGGGLLIAARLLLPLGAVGLATAYLVAYVYHAAQVSFYTAVVLRRGLRSIGDAPAARGGAT